MVATIKMDGKELKIMLPTPEIEGGIHLYDLGRKKSNLLPNGWFARTIQVFPSGKIRLMEIESIAGRGSGYSFPSNCEITIS